MCPSKRDVESVQEGSLTVYTESIGDSLKAQLNTSDAGGHQSDDLMMSKEDDIPRAELATRSNHSSYYMQLSVLYQFRRPSPACQSGEIEKRSSCTANRSHTPGLCKPPGIGSTHGPVYALPPTKSSARCAAVQEARG